MAKRLSVSERRRRRIFQVRGKIDWFENQLKNLPSQIQRYRDELDDLVLAEQEDKKVAVAESQTKLEGREAP